MIPQSFIQDLLNRVDIVDLIDRYVKLKRSGANYTACCPFHSEKSPSFTVSQTKQFYHCFGCGAHGTAIGFLIEYSGLGFVDAVKELAQGVGMKVPEEARAEKPAHQTSEGESLYDVLLKAAQFYRNELRNAPHAIEYLKSRGLSGDIAKRFGIGYAPAGWQNLERAFPDYRAGALAAGGLVKTNEEGRRYDVFRDRIIFPIVDVRGHVIGFGGRVLSGGPLTKGGAKAPEPDGEQRDAAGPKYLNSPETPIFEKGRELYGLYQARRAIRDAGRVIVVEGYMDVVGLAQHGIEYAVATLGTATTPVHVQKLLRQSEEIVFCFDGDAAGRRAAWRGLENSLAQLMDGKQVRFLFLPPEHDPDTFVREHGRAAFEAMLDKAVPLSQFLLGELSARVDRGTHEGRARLLQEAKPLIRQIAAPLLSLMLRKQLAELTGLTQQELDAEFQIKSQPVAAPSRAPASRQRSMARVVMELLLVDNAFAGLADRTHLAHAAGLAGVDQDELKSLERLLDALAREPRISSIGEFFRGTESGEFFADIEAGVLRWQERGLSADELKAEFAGAWRQLTELIRKARLAALVEKSRRQTWSPEEEAQFRLLQQPLNANAEH